MSSQNVTVRRHKRPRPLTKTTPFTLRHYSTFFTLGRLHIRKNPVLRGIAFSSSTVWFDWSFFDLSFKIISCLLSVQVRPQRFGGDIIYGLKKELGQDYDLIVIYKHCVTGMMADIFALRMRLNWSPKNNEGINISTNIFGGQTPSPCPLPLCYL